MKLFNSNKKNDDVIEIGKFWLLESNVRLITICFTALATLVMVNVCNIKQDEQKTIRWNTCILEHKPEECKSAME